MVIFLLTILLINLDIYLANKIVSCEFNNLSYGYHIATELQSFQFLYGIIDITFSNNIIDSTKLKFSQLPLIGKNISIQIENNIILHCDERKSNLILNRFSIPDLSFYVCENLKKLYQIERYGMGYHIPNQKHSIISQLKTNKYIDHSQFTLYHAFPWDNNGIIFFGGIPKEIEKGLYKKSCSVKGINGLWDCELSHVFISNIPNDYNIIHYKNNHIAYFSTRLKKIHCPRSFYELVINELFKEKIANGKCYFESKWKNATNCDCNSIKQLNHKQIIIVFENFKIRLKVKKLFKEQTANRCTFIFIPNKNGDSWIFGRHFIDMQMMTFDYDNKSIVFYSTNKFEKIHKFFLDSFSIQRINLLIVSIILGSLIAYFF